MTPLKPLPPPQQPIVGANAPSQPYAQYFQSLDQVTRGLIGPSINTQTANYILALSDAAGVVEMNVGVANTLTIAPNNSVPIPVGTRVKVAQIGAGTTTITAGAGVTIRNRSGLQLAGQYAVAELYKRGTDEWVASGDLA